MNRAAWLQDRRMQKFRDVLSRWEFDKRSAAGHRHRHCAPASRPPHRPMSATCDGHNRNGPPPYRAPGTLRPPWHHPSAL
jgi:hypothetical protein